jgi:hypothetical protein
MRSSESHHGLLVYLFEHDLRKRVFAFVSQGKTGFHFALTLP